MNTVAIIQARMNSTRLPGKVLMDIKGKPMLQHIVDRARASNVDNVVVATNMDSPQICDYCRNHGIPFVHSCDKNLIRRFKEAAYTFDAENIVRLWGDCPLVLPGDINEALKIFNMTSFEYIYHERHIGIFDIPTLEEWDYDFAEKEDFHKRLLEQRNSNTCHVGRSLPFKDSVDTMEDLEFIGGIYELL